MTRNELTKLWAKVTGKFDALIAGAPEALDTLKEIADKLGDDDDALAGLLSQLAGKANAADVYTKTEIGGIVDDAEDWMREQLAGKQDVSPITNAASGALTVNEYRDFGTVSALTVTLTGGTMTNYDLYKFSFTCASDSTTLTLPSGIKLPTDMEMEMATGRRFECVIDYANCLTFNCWD